MNNKDFETFKIEGSFYYLDERYDFTIYPDYYVIEHPVPINAIYNENNAAKLLLLKLTETVNKFISDFNMQQTMKGA